MLNNISFQSNFKNLYIFLIKVTFPGWERHFSGLSDSDLPSMGHDPHSLSHSHLHRMHRSRRGHLSPDKDVLGDLGDSDMESVASVTSSAFSTQSERPRGSRGLM